MNPTHEAVNLLPFSEQPRFLLQEFSSDPEMLLRALQNYPRADTSSNAEATLAHAAQVLGERPGERAILLITDADSNGYAQTGRLWQVLEQARPRVFALEMSSSGLAHGQDLMRDWASVGGGGYTQAATAQALETGFARAACALRGGAPYTVSATLAAEPPPPPPPGSIAVMPAAATEAAPTAGAAVEFIVDASGSMLQRMGSQRRIDIAKSALTHMTSEVLPAGTPLALRAFGHREAGSCRTDLEIPLGPLDPAAVGKVIAGLQAKDGAKTPIAAALRLTADDLRAAPGPKLLILLTDGEETCGGDPAAELERLRDLGLDVRVNIVGFGVDDAKTEKLFRDWAASAGGQYLPAKDAGELRAAVAAALRAPFRVLDASGAVVAEGTVGGPAVTAASGAYTVEVLTSPPRRFEDVILAPGEAVKLTY
jgi:Mg-chelatase subunit ChlD